MVYRTTQTMRARDAGRSLYSLEADIASPCFQSYKGGLFREGQSLHPEEPFPRSGAADNNDFLHDFLLHQPREIRAA